MAIKQYNEQHLHEPILDEGKAIKALQPKGQASVGQEFHLATKSDGIERLISSTPIDQGTLESVGGDAMPPDFILLGIAAITMFLGVVLFRRYRVLQAELIGERSESYT
jgi:hypothetical protein